MRPQGPTPPRGPTPPQGPTPPEEPIGPFPQMRPQGPNNEALRRRNKAVAQQVFNAFNTGDTKSLATLISPTLRTHGMHVLNPQLNRLANVERVAQEITHDHQAFPDTRFHLQEVLAEGDVVILRWTMTGTHRGPLFDRAPTGRKITVHGTEVMRIKDGVIVDHKDDGHATLLHVLSQLGWLDKEMLDRLGVQPTS